MHEILSCVSASTSSDSCVSGDNQRHDDEGLRERRGIVQQERGGSVHGSKGEMNRSRYTREREG